MPCRERIRRACSPRVDEAELASADVDIRFSFGTESMPAFRVIAAHLAAVRSTRPIAVEGVGHVIYYDPDATAAHLRTQAGDRSDGR